MKKTLIFILSVFAFLFLFDTQIEASDYNGKLGYEYSPVSTTFYYMNEEASEVELHIDGVGVYSTLKDDSGIFYYSMSNIDLKGKEYYYKVCYSDLTCLDSIDPFARSVNVDGNRNVILDPSVTIIENWENITSIETSAYNNSIYAIEAEKFVENIVLPEIEGEITNNSVFSKLSSESYYSGIGVGYSYLNNLGVKNLEIDNLYDANNYFSPNHNFSAKEDNYSAIKELKNFILEYKDIKMNVILRMDILTPSEHLKNSLSKSSSQYIENNRINLNNPMMKRYIKDVYLHWAREYKIDGFYIVDSTSYGNDFLNQIIEELKQINKDIMVYTDSPIGNEYFTSDNLQKTLFGSLDNSLNEGIINGNFSESNFENLVNGMFGGYYSDLTKYQEASRVINNIGSFDGADIYSKLSVIEGLSARESEILNKIKLGLHTIYSSSGIPRMIAGNEFLNTTQIDTSDILTIDEEKIICNDSKTLCYAKGDLKSLNWGLLRNGSNLTALVLYRQRYPYQFPNYDSMSSTTGVDYDKELVKSGILYLTIKYRGQYRGDIEKSVMLINYSGSDKEINPISDKDYSGITSLLGKVEGDENTTKVYGYTFFTFTQIKERKYSNIIYIIIMFALLIFIFGLRALFIRLLKVKRGIDYKEYVKEQKETNKANKKKKQKVSKEKGPSLFTMFLKDDPLVKNVEEKIDKSLSKKPKKEKKKDNKEVNTDNKKDSDENNIEENK